MIITPNHAHWGHGNSECWVGSKEEQWEAEWPVLLWVFKSAAGGIYCPALWKIRGQGSYIKMMT